MPILLKPLLGVIESLFDPLRLLKSLLRLRVLPEQNFTGGNVLNQVLNLLLLISDASLQLFDVDLSLLSDLGTSFVD